MLVSLMLCQQICFGNSALKRATETGLTELVPILQYANGTLNIVKTNRKELKQVLDMFSTITRFHINFDKNTFVPMSTYHSNVVSRAAIFIC